MDRVPEVELDVHVGEALLQLGPLSAAAIRVEPPDGHSLLAGARGNLVKKTLDLWRMGALHERPSSKELKDHRCPAFP
jgi:hypothetical protein